MISCVSSSHMMVNLPLDVREQSTGTYTKEFWLQPLISKLLLYKREPSKGILCTADASCWFKAYLVSSFPEEILMARSITIATGKVAFTVSFPVEVLIKSDPAIIAIILAL